MKLTKLVLFSLMAALPSMANASDIQDPFYMPQANHVLSGTSFAFSRAKMDIGTQLKPETKALSEYLTYGITDSLFAVASIANYLNDPKSDFYGKYETTLWNAGLSYKMSLDQNTSIRFGAAYTEEREEGEDRYNTVKASVLLEPMKDLDLKPFAAVVYNRNVEYFSKSYDGYDFQAGAWTKLNKASIIASLDYKYNHHYTQSETFINLEANYGLADNIAAGAGFSSMIHEHNTRYSSIITYGVHVKLTF